MQAAIRSSFSLGFKRRIAASSYIFPQRFVLQRNMATKQTGPLIDSIKTDHREIFEYYDQYTAAKGNRDVQERWARQMIWEVARHSISEEIVVYPLMERRLGVQGHEIADKDRSEHQEVKNRLAKLEDLTVGTTEYDKILKEVRDELEKHIAGEETHDLPLLEGTLSQEESTKTEKSFQRTKLFVPTRSHPSAPNKPPFETAAGLLAAPIDKLKDLFAKFPTEEHDMKKPNL